MAKLFSRYGLVLYSEVILDSKQASKGFGFVTMANGKDAEFTLMRLQNYIVDGRVISISLANPRNPRKDAVAGNSDLVEAERRLHQAQKEVMRLREELCAEMRLGHM